jgi:gluconolactonase
VFSAIGTYVGLRGGHNYSTLVRKTAPKPLRIFLQDGSDDLNIYAGDWWKANESMERALTFSGYEVKHVWGEEGHSGRQGTAIFPDVMRYLWKDWPQAIKTGTSKNQMLVDILDPAVIGNWLGRVIILQKAQQPMQQAKFFIQISRIQKHIK